MRIRRAFPIALALVIVAAAVILAVQLRKHAPPEAARLLPGADAFVYANLGWARKANGGKLLLPVAHDPEYERFIQETGFDFERDLEAAAFAIHYPEKWPGGGTGGAASEPRYSEVFTAKFDGTKCLAYLKKIAQSVENYNSIDIFTIPLYGRSFRIAILAVDTVAASNHDDPAVIRGIVDRSRRLASPFGGPALLRRYYRHVQLASPFWMVARTEPLARQFDTWAALFPKPADLVISASYNPLHFPLRVNALHLRAEAWATQRCRCPRHRRQGQRLSRRCFAAPKYPSDPPAPTPTSRLFSKACKSARKEAGPFSRPLSPADFSASSANLPNKRPRPRPHPHPHLHCLRPRLGPPGATDPTISTDGTIHSSQIRVNRCESVAKLCFGILEMRENSHGFR